MCVWVCFWLLFFYYYTFTFFVIWNINFDNKGSKKWTNKKNKWINNKKRGEKQRKNVLRYNNKWTKEWNWDEKRKEDSKQENPWYNYHVQLDYQTHKHTSQRREKRKNKCWKLYTENVFGMYRIVKHAKIRSKETREKKSGCKEKLFVQNNIFLSATRKKAKRKVWYLKVGKNSIKRRREQDTNHIFCYMHYTFHFSFRSLCVLLMCVGFAIMSLENGLLKFICKMNRKKNCSLILDFFAFVFVSCNFPRPTLSKNIEFYVMDV